VKAKEIREMARARKVINRLAISQESLWIDGFLAGLEAAKSCVVPDGNPLVALMKIGAIEVEARKAAGK
jgi:hypothetical protein